MRPQAKLFSDKETRSQHRPTELPPSVKKELYHKLATQIIENNWSSGPAQAIAEDLEGAPLSENGYSICSHLDKYGSEFYNFDEEAVEFAGGLYFQYRTALGALIKEWVQIFNITPQYTTGDCLQVTANIPASSFKTDELIYIIEIRPENAMYICNKDSAAKGGNVLAFELVENNTTLLLPN